MQPVQKPATTEAPSWTPTSVKHVWELPNGRFVFVDETERESDASYATVEEAASALNVYCWFVLEGLGSRLKTEPLEVTFKKADGTLRTMYCTSQPSAFPIRESTDQSRTKSASPDVQVVVDLEKKAIRSFRKDSVVSVNTRAS